jgi:hypothetical protein
MHEYLSETLMQDERRVIMTHKSTTEPSLSSPATYQITITGKLEQHWAEWFNGTLINLEHSRPESPHTILTCRVRDQAELYGILNRLNSLNLVLLQVMFIQIKGEQNVRQVR